MLPWPSRSMSSQNDHLLLTHFSHREWNAADAIARLPVASERHPVHPECRMVVDHDRRSCKPLGRAKRLIDVLREDAGLECDRQAVGNLDGLIQFPEFVN